MPLHCRRLQRSSVVHAGGDRFLCVHLKGAKMRFVLCLGGSVREGTTIRPRSYGLAVVMVDELPQNML